MRNFPHSGESVLTTAEVAEATGKSVATINRWADSGKLPVVARAPGVRGARFFRKSDVERLKKQGSAA